MRLCHLLRNVPLVPLSVMALLLGLAPFRPEPHLFEKVRMLTAGRLYRPIDILDLALHGVPVLLLTVRLLAVVCYKRRPAASRDR